MKVLVQHLLGAVFLKLMWPWTQFGLETYRQKPRGVGKITQQREVNQICITEKFSQVLLKPTSNFYAILTHRLCRVIWVVKHIPRTMSPNRTLFKHYGKSLDWPVQHTDEQATSCTSVNDQVVCKSKGRNILLSSKFCHGTPGFMQHSLGKRQSRRHRETSDSGSLCLDQYVNPISSDIRHEWLSIGRFTYSMPCPCRSPAMSRR
jgi:hypothetical protein